MYSSSDFLFVPLGGSGEIGMNANLYHYEGSWLMVDLGISFPDDSMPGIDVVLPDLSFIEARREQLAGLVLTHGHEDHLGAIPYMWSKLGCPVYGSAFTLALLRRKLAENNNPHDIPLIELSPGMVEDIGAFSVEMVGMAHSIPDPTSLAIRCDAGTVLHTGDWKFDESPGLGTDTDSNRLAEIGDEGVLAMIGDSTNAMVEGRTASEAEAEAGLRKVIAEAKGGWPFPVSRAMWRGFSRSFGRRRRMTGLWPLSAAPSGAPFRRLRRSAICAIFRISWPRMISNCCRARTSSSCALAHRASRVQPWPRLPPAPTKV